MTKTATLGLDLDNTFADFTGAMRDFVADAAGVTDEGVKSSMLPTPDGYSMENWNWRMTPFTGFLDAFYAAEETGDLYRTMRAHEGAVEAVRAIQDNGFSVEVVTARKSKFEGETREAMDRWGLDVEKIVFTDDKYAYPADIFIDDAPSHLEKFGVRNIPAIAYTNLYNAHLNDAELGIYGRITHWNDAVGMVEKVYATI